MPYTAPSLSDAAIALASRLNDPNGIYWVTAELYGYLIESLRWWSSVTQHWRDQDDFSPTPTEPFYDLPSFLPSLRGYNVTNWDLITDLQYSLLEPPAAGGTWTGTDQFTLDQLSIAVQRRRDQFLRETGAVVTRSVSASAIPPATGRVLLSEDILIVRRACWRVTSTQALWPLFRTDEWAANNYASGWPGSTSYQRAYSTTDTPPLELQIIDPPAAAGQLDLLSINKGAIIDPLVETPLNIPDDYAWVVKFGALADLLQGDGLALDPQRASYCENRWQQGVTQARAASVVLSARIDGVAVSIGAVADADAYSPTWSLVSGIPKKILLAGQNLIASWPPPGVAGPYTFTLDVVRNVPIPALTSDILQISQDVYDSILDYAQHLALFKQGPGQLELSLALLDRAARAAGIVDLQLQQAQQPARSPLMKQTAQDRLGAAPDQLTPVA